MNLLWFFWNQIRAEMLKLLLFSINICQTVNKMISKASSNMPHIQGMITYVMKAMKTFGCFSYNSYFEWKVSCILIFWFTIIAKEGKHDD